MEREYNGSFIESIKGSDEYEGAIEKAVDEQSTLEHNLIEMPKEQK